MYHLIRLLQQNRIVDSLDILKFIQDEESQFFYAGSKQNVLSSEEITLEKVLQVIEKEIQKK